MPYLFKTLSRFIKLFGFWAASLSINICICICSYG